MKHKLLSFMKNLIISMGLVVIVMVLFFTTSSFAASGDTLGKVMRETVATWYKYILRTSLAVYGIGYLIIIVKLVADQTPEKTKIVKESLLRFFVMFAVIYSLSLIMIAIMAINEEGINIAKKVGPAFSGLGETKEIDGKEVMIDEYDLYETVLSKAYEIAAVPGFIGLIMYLLLVYYTYKFVIIYAKRYINIIVLILLAPIIFVISTIKRIVTGVSDGKIKKWFKEFIFNVVIQTLHAIFYSILIGLTLKLSDDNGNLIGALLALIFFGFIFKIDAFIRKIFDFVGGSTKIRSSRRTAATIDRIGGVVNSGLGGIAAGATNLENNVEQYGLRDGFNQSLSDAQNYFGNKATQFGQNIEQIPSNIKQNLQQIPGAAVNGLKQLPGNIKQKAIQNFDTVKEVSKDFATARKVKVTEEEIVETAHMMAEKKGLEGLRQGIQNAGSSVIGGLMTAGKYSKKQTVKALKFANKRVKYGISETAKEFNEDIKRLELENEVELIKRLPKIIRNYNKKQRLIKMSYEGVKLDATNAMMLAVDINFDTKTLIEELKKEYNQGNPIIYKAFEKLSAKALLSPISGSARFGLAMLAEERYEEVAEHRIEELLFGIKRKKKVIKKARKLSNIQIATTNNVLLRKEKHTENGELLEKKTYKFSRFSTISAKKITNRVLRKSRENNVYLNAITKVSTGLEVDDLKIRRTISGKPIEINHTIKSSRVNQIKSVRVMKMEQQAAVANHKEYVRQTRRIEMANNVAGQIMSAANVIKLGFRQIDNMTPGQVGLRNMIMDKQSEARLTGAVTTAQTLPASTIFMRENATVEDKIKATGFVKEGEQTVLQFVVTEEGKIVPQIVTQEGRIVTPAIDENGEMVIHSIINQVMNDEQPVLQKRENETEEQFAIRQIVSQAFTQYIQQEQPEIEELPAVQVLEDETEEQALFREFVNQTLSQYFVQIQEDTPAEEQFTFRKMENQAAIQPQNVAETVGEVESVQVEKKQIQPKLEQQPQFVQEIVEAYQEYVEKVQNNEVHVDIMEEEGETKEQAIIREFANHAFVQYIEPSVEETKPVITSSEEGVKNLEQVIQHVVTLNGDIVEQAVNLDNTIDTDSYKILDNGGDLLLKQVQDIMTNNEVVSNEDLGLPEDATVENKVEVFENLLADIQRETSTQDLLNQVVEMSTEEEKEIDELLVGGMQEAKIESIQELKQLRFDENIDDEGLQKKEAFEKFITERMVTTGVLTSTEVEDDDIVGDALDVLNSRVDTLSSESSERLFDTAVEMERTRIAEELINKGEFTVENPPSKETVDEKVENLSTLLQNLAEETTRFPREVLEETADAFVEVVDNAEKGKKSKEEIQYEKALEKAEKKWAKKHGKEADISVIDKYEKNQKGKEDDSNSEPVKITINFYGAVVHQGQSVTLSNRHSMKDFYNKANKLDNADLAKTLERFLQNYGDKLQQMQLMPFNFGKNPVEDMDGWSIYVVTDKEDVTQGEKEKKSENEMQEEITEPIPASAKLLIDKYFVEIKKMFVEFIEKNEITSFNEIRKKQELSQTFVRTLRTFLFRQGESNEQSKALEIFENMYKDKRFESCINDSNRRRQAKEYVSEKLRKTRENSEATVKPEVKKTIAEKENEKSNLMDQILDNVMTSQEEAAASNPELNDLLRQLRDTKFYVTVGENENENKNRRMLQYQTSEGEMMP